MSRLLDYFPIGHPDEALHSRISRYHRLSGNRHDRHTLQDIFGRHTLVITSHLPSHLATLSAKLPDGEPYRIASLIESATLLPYFRPFLSARQARQCVDAMQSDDAGALKISIGLSAGRVGGQNPFRYCPACAKHDEREYGVAYWHRAHLLPGVVVCPVHRVALHAVNPAWVRRHRHRLFLPGDPEVASQARPAEHIDEYISLLSDIALLSAQVLHAAQAPLDREWQRNSYRALASDAGLIDKFGRLKRSAAEQCVVELGQSLPSLPDFAFVRHNGIVSARWGFSLLQRQRTTIHPLKHILLLWWLRQCVPQGDQRTNCMSPSANQRRVPRSSLSLDVSRLQTMLCLQEHSLRRCAEELGVSVTTVGIEARRRGLPVKIRPKSLNQDKIRVLCKALVSTHSLQQISSKHGVAVVTLYRILRIYPDVAAQRATMIFAVERERRRELFVRDMRANALRQCRGYTWLYRHDRAWLMQIVEKHRQRISMNTSCINWPMRDVQWMREIGRTYELLLTSATPIRITKSALIQSVEHPSTLEKSLYRLPLTSAAIAEFFESTEQFQCRRLEWAAAKIEGTGEVVKAWRLQRLAGVKRPFGDVVRKKITELVSHGS